MSKPAETWPEISYLHEGTRWARQVRDELVVLEKRNWRLLCKAKSDGSFWRLDEVDKNQTRFLVKLTSPENWVEFDSSDMEKHLLIKNRGGHSDEECRKSGCEMNSLKGSAFCEHHTYEMGVRV